LTIGENEYYNGLVWSNVTMVYDNTNSLYNAGFISIIQNSNYSWSLIGTPGPDDSGTYNFNLIFYNAISYKYVNFTLTVENTVYCYINSTPETEMTVGDMYNYHPDIVCNGTYTLGINNNGALVVSNGTGNVTGSPTAGIYNIELYVIDSSGNIAYQNWTLTVLPFTSLWSNDDIVSFSFLVIVMGILTIFNFIGYIKNIFLIQALSIALMIFAIPLIWSGKGPAIAAMIISIVGNLGITISGFFKES